MSLEGRMENRSSAPTDKPNMPVLYTVKALEPKPPFARLNPKLL